MLKQILNLVGAQKLSKNEQKTIQGGRENCYTRLIGGGFHYNCEGYPPSCCGQDGLCPDRNHPCLVLPSLP